MKKITLIIILSSTLMLTGQTNLLQNGSFEEHTDGYLYTSEVGVVLNDGRVANPYWFANSNPGRNIRLFINADFAQDQTNFINIGFNVNPQSLIQEFTAVANTEYTVTLWHKIQSNSTTVEALYPSATVLAGTNVLKNQVLDGSLPNGGDWVKTTFTFNSGNNTFLRFRVNRPINPAPVVRFDNISIVESSTASIDDFTSKFNFKSFPNPTNDIVNLSASEKISQVEVYNLLGASVMSKKINSDKSSIDLREFSSGVYFFKVSINESVKTFKVLKN